MNAASIRASAANYLSIFRLLRQHPGILIGLVLASVSTSISEGFGLALILPLFQDNLDYLHKIPLIGPFLQNMGPISTALRLQIAALALVGVALVNSVCRYSSRHLANTFQLKVEARLRRLLFERVLAADMQIIHRHGHGRISSLIGHCVSETSFVVLQASNALISILQIATFMTMMIVADLRITVLALSLVGATSVLIHRILRKKLQYVGQHVGSQNAQLSRILADAVGGLRTIRLFACEGKVFHLYSDVQTRCDGASRHRAHLLSLVTPVFLLATGVALAAVLFIGSYWIGTEGSPVSMMSLLILIILMQRMQGPIITLNESHAGIAGSFYAYEDINRFLTETRESKVRDGSCPIDSIRDRISLVDVGFQYSAGDAEALRGVTLEIPVGKMTAIVGPSGSGKTTLVNLLARLYDPTRGQIRADGVDLTELTIASWRSQLAYVSQDMFLFNDTVAANIRFAKENATDEEIRHAARLAYADDFISKLPEGYETVLGDRGIRLSGGQQQRLAIARAVVAERRILILDEATSHLDAEAEHAIQQALDNLRTTLTVVVIAHRLATVRKADNIIVLVDGEVAEQGTHDELAQRGGRYSQMTRLQDLMSTNQENQAA